MAARSFPARKNIKNPGVAIFAEHDTHDEEGRPVHYGLKDLVGICQHANDRISELKAFPAISEGHTPDKEDQHEPPALCYIGSYQLGMIGDKKHV
mgnify:CR=1 FL=1